jgi:hypothetical protein
MTDRVSNVHAAALSVVVGLATIVVSSCGPPSPEPLASPSAGAAQASPSASATHRSHQEFIHPTGRWSIEYPTESFTRDSRLQGQAFTSYDPATASWEQGRSFESAGANLPQTELRVDVEVWPNESGWDSATYASEVLKAPPHLPRVISSSPLPLAGQQEQDVVLEEDSPWGFTRRARYVFVPRPDRTHMILIRAWPEDSTQRSELDRMIASFRFR